MALLKAEAEKLSNDDLQRGVIEEIITLDETFQVLPFVKTMGKAYVYNRENALGTAAFVDPYETIAESASTFTQVVVPLTILAGDVDVDKFLNETMADTNDQLAIQIALKAKGIGRVWQDKFINGNSGSDPAEFDGLNVLAAGARTTASTGSDGDALSFAMLDQLADEIPYGPDAFIMNSKAIRAYRALLRAGGGNDGSMLQLRNFDRPMLTHNGVPILKNDWIGSGESKGVSGNTLTSIYAVRMNEQDGLHGIYGGSSAGFRIEEIGTVQDKDAWRVRVKWYSGLALKSSNSLARFSEVIT